MKLHSSNFAVVLFAHKGKREPFSDPCLASSRRPLKDQIFFRPQSLQKPINFAARKEAAVLNYIGYRVRFDNR